MFREVLDRSVTVPDRSETQSPTGSMYTICSMASTSTHSGSAVSGSPLRPLRTSARVARRALHGDHPRLAGRVHHDARFGLGFGLGLAGA